MIEINDGLLFLLVLIAAGLIVAYWVTHPKDDDA